MLLPTDKKSKSEKKQKKNAEKVHGFLKNIADECLGKKFLIKIPKATNLLYNKEITIWDDPDPIQVHNYATGPFGFRPMPISASGDKYPSSLEFVKEINSDDKLSSKMKRWWLKRY